MDSQNDNPSIETRRKILAAALSSIPFDGWTQKTLNHAVTEIGLPIGASELYFPGGAAELLMFWSEEGDRKALEKIEARGNMDNLRIREKITECVWIRLSEMQGEEQVARRAMSRLALPDVLGQGAKQIWTSADMIWRAVGDTSTDGNFYSKRTILSGVISTSILSWLADNSEDKSNARAFLEARIENVMQFEKAKFSWRKQQEKMPKPADLLSRVRYRRRRRRY